MMSRNVYARPRFVCLALVCLMFVSAAPLLTAASIPVAVVAPDGVTVQVGEEVLFTGEGSYCSDGNITSYIWDLGDGTRASGLTVSHAYSAPGDYTVTLVVAADNGVYGTDTGTISVVERTGDGWTAWIESASTAKTSYAPGETINSTVLVERGLDMLTAVWEGWLLLEVLDASGDAVHRDDLTVWLPRGGSQQTSYFELALDEAGDYLLRLYLYWRNDTLVDTADLNVTVARDKPPVDMGVTISDLTTDRGNYQEGDVMDVTVDVTRGPDMLDYVWDGTLVLELLDVLGAQLGRWDRTVHLPHDDLTQTFSISVDLTSAGDRLLVATLYWVDGAIVDGRQLNVTVTPEDRNQPPTAVIDPPEQTISAGDVARLDGSASRDADGRIASHLWELGDGTTADGPLATHTYRLPGVYNVTLTVTDDDGATSTAYAVVEVLANLPPPEAWIVSIDADDLVNGTVTVGVMRGGDMLDYVWGGTLILEVIGVGVPHVQQVSLATGGELVSYAFRLSLTEEGDHVLRATLLRHDGTAVDVEEVVVTVPPGLGEEDRPVPPGRDLPDVPATAVAAAGLVVVLGTLAATEVGKASLLGLLVPLYSRLRKEDVLDHFTRGKIYGYILANPGDNYNSIQKALGIPNGTFAYHLHVLEKEGYIRSTREGMNRLFFPAGMSIPDQGRTLRASQRLIVEKILEEPGISQKEIAASMGVSAATVSYHIKGLLAMGVVETERMGMSLKYYINRELLLSPG